MKSIDWEDIWSQRGPIEPPPVCFDLTNASHKHRLKLVKDGGLQHMIIFLCLGCDWIVVCRRVLLRHVISGSIPWNSEVLYRTWTAGRLYQDVNQRNTQDAARTTPGCGERSD